MFVEKKLALYKIAFGNCFSDLYYCACAEMCIFIRLLSN